jgi:hypothetical protein
VFSLQNQWSQDNHHWSFYSYNSVAQAIGKNCRNDSLYIAKYVDGNNSNTWHGYPVDPRRGTYDRPSSDILHQWVQMGIIDKPQANRIKAGKTCSLLK